MSQRIDTYLRLRRELIEASTALTNMAGTLAVIAEKMADWKKVQITHLGPQGYPMLPGQTVAVSADDWPTAQQAAVAIHRYHEAKKSAEKAHAALTPDERSGVMPLDP
jgi:hypothetical protein